MTSSILLLLLYVIPLTLQLESDTFRIFNKENRKCLHALSDMIKVSDCSKDSNTQKFRWISKDRLINVAVPKCLAVSAKNEMSLVSLSSCDAESELQKWECKNDTLFGIQGESLYLNYGNKNVIISKALGSWSRWSIYGTSDDLCAKAYEEIYSIKGNGNGKPCVFPFKYKSKWYADCTTDGAENADLWCATIQDYDKDPQWGYCPIKSTREGWWATDSISGFLYQVNQDAALTWYQARKSCHQQDAELLSITEVHEQTYMSGVANSHALTLWTGLHNLDLNAGWKWTDGSPFRFLNWRPGYPVVENGKNCVVLEPDENGKWENLKCSERLGYVCKKGNITSYTSPSDTKPINCPPTWISYAGYCYYLHREAKNWQDAKVSCRKEEGDLASLHNIEESSFVNSIFQFDSEHIWLGLNDLKTQMYFEWSDGTPVTYTIWEKGEPSHIDNRQEDCVALNPKVGQWSDQSCEKKFPYMCKRKPLPFDHERLPIIEPGCSTGWKRHGFYCYYIGEEISTFSEANSSCNAHSAFLMTVDDRLEQAYLTSLIGLRPEKYFWTGLSDIEERGIFKWTTSDRVLYSHWDADMPGRKQGCVVMRTGNKGGLWDVINCDETAKFVCKKWAEGVTPPPIPTTTPEPKCPPEWRTSSHISSCFKSYSKPNGEKKRWTEAREFCQAIGGELASINNRDEQDVVLSAMLAVGVTSGSWIGLVSSDPSEGFQWSDGSPLIYENWRFGEPNNYQGIEMCAEIDNTFNMRWNDRPCEYLKDWICELKKGAALIPEPTNSPYPEFNLTHDGWLIRGDKQYYVGKTEMSMDKARDFCRHNYGNLVTINDEEERTFLWRYILKNRTHDSYYIGLVLSVDKQFRWMDGSPVDYVAWAVNEPNFSNNDENCVEMYKDSGLWNDINCGNPGSFICERHMNNINTTFPPTVPPPRGGCLAGWMAFGGKCYKIFGKNTDESVDWHTGRLECQKWEGNLVTINDDLVQDFLTYNLRDLENPVWIGLNDISQDRRYRWTDQSGVHYTKWAKGHPSYRYIYGKENNVDCVAMEVGERMNAGSWTEIDCKLERGFICQKSEDPSLPVGTTVSPPPDHYQLGNASYKFQKTKKNWHEAQRMCKESDYELASIIDPYSASFIRIQIHTFKEPFWVGLYSNNQTDNRYKWTDDWKLRYTRWAPDEPKEKSACVYVDVDGQWKTASCDENYASVCWQTSAKAPIEPPQKPGKCPESSSQAWIPFHEHCYIVEASDSYTWGQASIKCLQLNGNMVSIEDQHEQDFLFEHAELLSDKENAFWIGLYRNVEGNWLWMDKTAMDYVNWDRGGPSDSSVSEEDILIRYRFYSYEQTFNRDCVSMDAKSGIWINYDCSGRKGYICKTLKIPVSSDNTTQPEKFKQDQRPSHGVAVGVSLLVIAIIASATIVAYLVYRKKPTKVPDTEPQNFDNTLYFSSSQDASVQDTNILINNMEQL